MDVKPEEFARRDEVAQVFAWTGRLCASRGWSYEVRTGSDRTTSTGHQQSGASGHGAASGTRQ
ncbi:MAG: hypothetical protein EOO27_17225 [Comamonadaceae bacterium]|nr:MAG: hypothetical protein EOO27_17225 [Comamonadaceae bacterium]